ncbi:ROK family protein [Paenibacillus sp. MAH-36]|uniref:ROK family transcriptional regulator n=1 Tax=Paenibacillus violae TaxID=3077234 RepID=A0ABU3RR69_9BACL|nr:ROK family transcriptional regulator [Paenibacillus sp. PFR10]MDU0206352.1 ROK family transcriptional regulator [Paenibacillus sp. PFR10]
MAVVNTADIRSMNKKNIIQAVRSGQPATKKAIADGLGLSFATVSNLCNQLIEEGILKIASSENSSGGRIPGLISLEPGSRGSLCLDLNQPEHVNASLLNLQNETLDSVTAAIPSGQGLTERLQVCYEVAMQLLDRQQMSYEHLLGVGAAIPGIFYKKNNTVINSTIPIFENQPVKKLLEDRFQLPVYLENESNILALATSTRLQLNSGERQEVAYIYIAEGLGVGITHQGAIFGGNRGFGGEVSHMPLGSNRYSCYCGQEGCVETELSLFGFWKSYSGTAVQAPSDSLASFWKEFVEAAQSGEERARQVLGDKGRLLGKLISVITNLFDPDEVYVGGMVEPIFPFMYPYLLEEATSRVITKDFYFPAIKSGGDYEETMHQGCAEMVFKFWSP